MSDVQKGRGTFRISWDVLPTIFVKGLLLPDGYEIVDVLPLFTYSSRPVNQMEGVELIVESASIPLIEGVPLPEITACYIRKWDEQSGGQTFLDRIEMNEYAVDGVVAKVTGRKVLYKCFSTNLAPPLTRRKA